MNIIKALEKRGWFIHGSLTNASEEGLPKVMSLTECSKRSFKLRQRYAKGTPKQPEWIISLRTKDRQRNVMQLRGMVSGHALFA